MKLRLTQIALLSFLLIFVSCTGQTKSEEETLTVEKVSEVNKISVPKNGFFNGYADRDGTLWFCSNGGGVYHYDGKIFKTYSVEDGLCNKRIRAIFEDPKGNIWLGAGLGNLCIFDGQRFSEFSYNGQTFADVLFIFGDLEDNIWFGGKNGIWKYDGQTITELTKDEH